MKTGEGDEEDRRRTMGEQKNRKNYVRYSEGADLYSMSKGSFMKLAKEAHAVYKIGSIVLVNVELFDRYLETFRE